MMRCKAIENLLWALCEGSLSRDSARLVEEHLAGCEACSRARSEIRATLTAMRGVAEGVGDIEPSRDFEVRLRQRIDAWETGRGALWVSVWAGFLARNRRLLVTSGVAFAVALVGGLYVMKGVVGPERMVARQDALSDRPAASYEGVGLASMESAPEAESSVRQDYVLREIPYPAPVLTVSGRNAPDTIYVRFPTREITPPIGMAGDNYIYQPVVTPVSEGEPAF